MINNDTKHPLIKKKKKRFLSLQQYFRRAEHVLSCDGESSLYTVLVRQIPWGISIDQEAISLRDTARPLLFPGTFNGHDRKRPGKLEFIVSTAPTQLSDNLRREKEMRSLTHQSLHAHSGQHTCKTNVILQKYHATQAEGFCPPMGCFNALSATTNFQ